MLILNLLHFSVNLSRNFLMCLHWHFFYGFCIPDRLEGFLKKNVGDTDYLSKLL